ncbi:MAG: hypothetical protein JKY50_16260 [Oleispira sp.]|nr:hypothetical protein [Oleispira sp.]MBL4882684.1 hypothetical protein [Oleispira sp.]
MIFKMMNISELKVSVEMMAKAMCQPMPSEPQVELLFDHVLYDDRFGDVDGKNGCKHFELGLITKSEFRDLVMAHSASKISFFSGRPEPSFNSYESIELNQSFEKALLGKIIE